MKIYFSQVPSEDVASFGDEGLLGPCKNGKYYYNQVEFGTNPGGTDEVAISDGCNRYIPLTVDVIPELISALIEFYNMHKAIKNAEDIKEEAESDTVGYTEKDQEYIDEPISSASLPSIQY
jgi:hypothetical protein